MAEEKKGLAAFAEHQGALWGALAMATLVVIFVLPEAGRGIGMFFANLAEAAARGANAVQSTKVALMGVAVTLLLIATAVVGLIKWLKKPPAPPAP